MGKTFCIGDIHGGHKALLQCLERSGFNNEEDTLISLGDIVDGWLESYECVEELLKIKNLIAIKGNHDDWFAEFLKTGIHGSQWTQGAYATKESYIKNCDLVIPESHEHFFLAKQINYHIDEQNRCFVHGGFNRHLPIDKQDYAYIYFWDRDLWLGALSAHKSKMKYKIENKFEEIFIGHTTTSMWDKTLKPMNACNIWNLDTGGGFEGCVTIMNVDTKEYFQSDLCKNLYSNEQGRN
jgi:serine/threonine protein phosphatase 1